jgi:glycosyltransferase involved in cell wall biosynthesis
MSFRVIYAGGPGDIIGAHKFWRQNEHCPDVVSITFSSEFEELCEEMGAEAYIVASHSRRAILKDGAFVVEHRPKPMPEGRGMRYHLSEILYGLGLAATALRFRADVAVIHSGTTHYFVASLFPALGIRVIIVMHNTLWPGGFPPTRLVSRAILALDALFFRHAATAVVGASPECTRQVEQVTRGRHAPLYQIRYQYRREIFVHVPPPPSFDQRPVQIVFVGRANRFKGIFDILELAQLVESRLPGQVRWEICGAGPDLEELRRRHRDFGLESIVNIRGWTSPSVLPEVYARSFASIVPTRSSFFEGLGMSAVESILAGRPVITNPVVPALEVLRPACLEVRTDDVESYADGVLKLISDRECYDRLRFACSELAEQFYDRGQGQAAVLKRIIEPIKEQKLRARGGVAAEREGPVLHGGSSAAPLGAISDMGASITLPPRSHTVSDGSRPERPGQHDTQ